MNKFIHVGNVPYGESEVIELDYFQLKIKDFKFDCPCVKAYYQQEKNIIVATFIGNERPKPGKDYQKIINLTVKYETGEEEGFDLLLTITRDYDT